MIIAIAFSSEPCASTTAPIRPSTISEKYSAGPNFSASSDSGIATVAISIVATVPAKNDASAEIASAAPAWPLRAIWWPSRQVTTDDVSPGMLMQDRRRRAAVLRAVVDAGQHDQRRHRLQRIGRRQQHRDRRDRTDAGQHADQRAEQRRR